MKISVESFTATGSRHLQPNKGNHDSFDFGTADNGTFWAVVSDGCSSARFPRRGADDMAAAVRKILTKAAGPVTDARIFEGLLLEELNSYAYVNPLHYCATAVVLQMHQGKGHVFFYGDGSLLLRNRDGIYTEKSVLYSGNAPRYLHYFLKAKPEFLGALDPLSPRWSDFIYPPQEAYVLSTIVGEYASVTHRSDLSLAAPCAFEVDLSTDDVWNLLICTDGVTHKRESLVKAILEHADSTGIPQACEAAQTRAGFIPPSDDATFVNIALL